MQLPARTPNRLPLIALYLAPWILGSCVPDHGDHSGADPEAGEESVAEMEQPAPETTLPDTALPETELPNTTPENTTPGNTTPGNTTPGNIDSESASEQPTPTPASIPTTEASQESPPPSDVDLPPHLRDLFTVEDPRPMEHGELTIPYALRHIATDLIFLYVPAGNFTLGSDADDPDRFDDERPPRRVRMTGFYMSATETTLAAWRQGGGEAGSGLEDSHPVTGVNWYEARDWSVDNGLALPTEAQWEYAASGSRNDLFPWGYEERVKGNANAAGTNDVDLWLETSPVDSFPNGTSWCGIVDLAGNVMEWCGDEWTPGYGDIEPGATDPVFEAIGEAPTAERLVRGGSFESDALTHLRCAYRNALLPSLAGANLGFRAVVPNF